MNAPIPAEWAPEIHYAQAALAAWDAHTAFTAASRAADGPAMDITAKAMDAAYINQRDRRRELQEARARK